MVVTTMGRMLEVPFVMQSQMESANQMTTPISLSCLTQEAQPSVLHVALEWRPRRRSEKGFVHYKLDHTIYRLQKDFVNALCLMKEENIIVENAWRWIETKTVWAFRMQAPSNKAAFAE